MPRLEFFFDCSSPWTYLAFESVQPVAQRHGTSVEWRPILVGGVFNSVNPAVYEARRNPVPARAAWAEKDLQDWARYHGITIGQPPVFPVNSVRVMRGAFLALEQERLVDYAREAFRTYWRDLEDIGQPPVLRGIAQRSGLDPDELEAYVERDDVKARLRANTEELVARGGFGSPTMFLDEDDMYFGNDRMPLVDAALARAREHGEGRQS